MIVPLANRTAAPWALAIALFGAACGRTSGDRPDAPSAHPDVRAAIAAARDAGTRVVPAHTAAHPIDAPRTAAVAPPSDACSVRVEVQTAAGWSLKGFQPGPTLRDIVALDRRRLMGITGRHVCTSDDDGEHWTERLALGDLEGALAIEPLDDLGSWLATAHAPAIANGHTSGVTAVYLSRDRAGEHWDPVVIPPAARTVRGAFSDGLGRLFIATETQLFESEDGGGTWSSPRALPGRESTDLDACGPTLIAHARVDDDWFYHRSFDHGLTWRPFRLGAIGLEATSAMLRCATDRGGIEAGRPPLPMNWSWDGGHTWSPAPYDSESTRIARTLVDNPAAGVAPHCMGGPGTLIECVDTGRAWLLRQRRRALVRQDIQGPSSCEHVRQVDVRRSMAFGPGCGLYISGDRGGVWRQVSQSLATRPRAAFAEGRGGFINARTAWRLDGGVWWTFDGGEHWRPFDSIGAHLLDRGVFVDSHHGVFATSNGWVTATRDGGHTWTYVLRGEVERIAVSHRAVIVTTTQSVRISPDGGVTWLANGTAAPSTPLDATVDVVGTDRAERLAPELRVVQHEDRIVMDGASTAGGELARGLPRSFAMLAAHATRSRVDRVLFEGGIVLARESGN